MEDTPRLLTNVPRIRGKGLLPHLRQELPPRAPFGHERNPPSYNGFATQNILSMSHPPLFPRDATHTGFTYLEQDHDGEGVRASSPRPPGLLPKARHATCKTRSIHGSTGPPITAHRKKAAPTSRVYRWRSAMGMNSSTAPCAHDGLLNSHITTTTLNIGRGGLLPNASTGETSRCGSSPMRLTSESSGDEKHAFLAWKPEV